MILISRYILLLIFVKDSFEAIEVVLVETADVLKIEKLLLRTSVIQVFEFSFILMF